MQLNWSVASLRLLWKLQVQTIYYATLLNSRCVPTYLGTVRLLSTSSIRRLSPRLSEMRIWLRERRNLPILRSHPEGIEYLQCEIHSSFYDSYL